MITIYINNEAADLAVNQSLLIQMENPLLEVSSIPVPHSIDIDIPRSPKNKELLSEKNGVFTKVGQYIDILFHQYILFSGTVNDIERDEFSFKLSCTGGNIPSNIDYDVSESILSTEAITSNSDADSDYRSTKTASEESFIYPMMWSNGVDYKYLIDNGLDDLTSAVVNYYDVFTDRYYVTKISTHSEQKVVSAHSAVFMAKWLLPRLLPMVNYVLPENLVIIPSRTYNHYSGWTDSQEVATEIDVAEYFSGIRISDLIKDILTLFGMTLYAYGRKFIMRNKADALLGVARIDWTNKISDDVTVTIELGDRYYLSFSGSSEELPTGIPRLFDTIDDMVANISQIEDSTVCIVAQDCFELVEGRFRPLGKLPSSLGDQNDNEDDSNAISLSFELIGNTITNYYHGVSKQDGVYGWRATTESNKLLTMTPEKTAIGYLAIFNEGSNTISQLSEGDLGEGEDPNTPNENVSDITYPYITTSNYNHKGDKIADYPLDLTDNSAIREHLTGYMSYLSRSKNHITGKVKLSAAELANLDLSQKVRYLHKDYFIKKLSININNNALEWCDFELLSCDVL